MSPDSARRAVATSYNVAVLLIIASGFYIAWTGSTRAIAALVFSVWLTLSIQGALPPGRRSNDQ